MANVTCSGPNHASLSAQPGWQTVLGNGDRNIPGHFCRACQDDAQATIAGQENVGRAARVAAFLAFRTATGLTVAQTMRLFELHDRGEA